MKKTAFMLFITMLFSAYTTVFAAEEKLIASAINAASQKIEIPDNFTNFSSDITIEQNSKLIRLMWSGESTGDKTGGQIITGIDEKNRIIQYFKYEYGKYTGDYKLSKTDYNLALKVAKEEIDKMCPEFAPYIKAKPQINYTLLNNGSYNIIFYRYENNIPCYDNYIFASVNAHNGKLAQLEVKWDDVVKISPYKNTISRENAIKSFYDKIGIELSYQQKDNEGDTFMQYSTNLNGSEYINAYTGDILNTNIVSNSRNTAYYQKVPSVYKEQWIDTDGGSDNEIENYVRNIKELSITDKYILLDTKHYADSFNNNYELLMFAKKESDQTINVTVNTATKEIVSYSKYPINADYNFMLSKEDCKRIAVDFCTKYLADKYNQCSDSKGLVTPNIYDSSTKAFYFSRTVNGPAYNKNGISIVVSSATGDIVSVAVPWQNNVNFSLPEGVISPETAYSKMIENIGFELQYVTIMPKGSKNYELRLVYSFSYGVPLFIDAKTGGWTYNSGDPYIPDHTLEFSDIEGNKSQKQIETLLSCGILPYRENFYPDKLITQKEFLQYALKVSGKITTDNADNLYAMLMKQNIINADERNDNAPVTTEQGIKYLIRILGYSDIAELEDTYQTGFVDEGMIDPKLIGYAAIAKGFNIIQGNAFTPKTELTRAVAAEIFYNMITN